MKLIYRCGRFRDRGYITLFGGGEPPQTERAAADRLWQGLQRGRATPGETGIVRELSSEGRSITEVLVLSHGRLLSPEDDTKLSSALNRFYETELAKAVAASGRIGVDSQMARQSIAGVLSGVLPELARLVPQDALIASTKKDCPPQARLSMHRRNVLGIAVAASVLLVIGLSVFLVSRGEQDRGSSQAVTPGTVATGEWVGEELTPIVSPPADEKAKAAVEDFLQACHGPQAEETVSKLAEFYAGRALVFADGDGRRDRLQLLRPKERMGISDLSNL